MISRVELVLSNPAWRRVDNASTEVFTTATTSPGAAAPVHHYGDGITVRVSNASGEVQLFRSITTSDQLYFTVHDGLLTITDRFIIAVATLPCARRTVPETAIVDHFLFRTTPGTSTYVAEVGRVGNGEHVSWSDGEARPIRRVRERLDRPRQYQPQDAALGLLDTALQQALRPSIEKGAVNMLSGGVDSTLLQSYLPEARASVSATIDSPEFVMEQGYALAAARLFRLDHRLVQLQEAEFSRRLEDVIGRSGLPPHHLQTVLIDAAVRAGGSAFVTAQFADALFGLDSSLRAWRIQAFRLATLYPATAVASLLPWQRLRRFRAVLERDLIMTSKGVADPLGFALLFATYTNMDAAVGFFGADIVRERLRARYEYVAARVDPFDSRASAVMRHLEAGHWVDFFCDDTVSIWRQVALSWGARLDAPFSHRAVVETALCLDPSSRFCARGHTKPLLKKLLRQRVPAYPASQPKGGSGLPVARFLKSGPLMELAEDALGGDWPIRLLDEGGNPSAWMLWNQLTLRIWDRVVLRATEPPGNHSVESTWSYAARISSSIRT